MPSAEHSTNHMLLYLLVFTSFHYIITRPLYINLTIFHFSLFLLQIWHREMAGDKYRQVSLLIFGLIAGLLSQNLVIPVLSAATQEQKTYYSPDPHGGKSHHGGKKM